MKSKRNFYIGTTWSRVRKADKEYRKMFWKNICPYSTRWKTCARAAVAVRLSRYRAWKNQLPKEVRNQTHFYGWINY